MTKRVKIFLGWPSTGTSETMHLYLIENLRDRYGEYVEFKFPDFCAHRLFHDCARNSLTEEFLASDCDVMWMLDSDVVPPNHILDLVVHHYDKWQIAGAPYPVFMQVPGTQEMSLCFTAYKGVLKHGEGRGIVMTETPQEGTEVIDALATGCLFIKREVFDQLERPFFEFKFDKETRRIVEGEDLGFALKCHDKGIKFFVDYGMVCKHYKRVCLLDMNNYAISMANQKVIEYDKQLRIQVEMISQEFNRKVKEAYERGLREGNSSSPVTPPRTKSGLILPDQFARK